MAMTAMTAWYRREPLGATRHDTIIKDDFNFKNRRKSTTINYFSNSRAAAAALLLSPSAPVESTLVLLPLRWIDAPPPPPGSVSKSCCAAAVAAAADDELLLLDDEDEDGVSARIAFIHLFFIPLPKLPLCCPPPLPPPPPSPSFDCLPPLVELPLLPPLLMRHAVDPPPPHSAIINSAFAPYKSLCSFQISSFPSHQEERNRQKFNNWKNDSTSKRRRRRLIFE